MQFSLCYHRLQRPVKPRYRLFQAAIILLLSIGVGLALTSPAQAATITVDGTTCTLANAITAANNDTVTGGCSAGSGADTLTLTADVTLGAVLPAISSDMTIQGDIATRFVSGNNARRVFTVNSGTVTFQDLTIQNGRDVGGNGGVGWFGGGGGLGAGGAIFVDSGTITIRNVTLTNNNAIGGNGGADNSNSTGGKGGGSTNDPNAGGNGGGNGQNGSFGGGGGGNGSSGGRLGGVGGFGAGGGGGEQEGNGGFGGGRGNFGGGGGAGLGGAIFIRAGALTVSNSTFTSNSANGGSGPNATAGSGIGGAVFICTAAQDGSCSATASGNGNTFTSNSANTSADVFGTIASAADPEIDVLGNDVSIVNGDSTPDAADHTDFGSVHISGGSIVRTFTINNTGDADLTLTGSPLVALSGDSAFSAVTGQPNISSVVAGGSTQFQITFDPSAVGTVSAMVSIASDDSDENPYTFIIQGIGTNSAPTATDDSYGVDEDTPLSITAPGLLGNDNDVDGDTLSALLVAAPANGTLTLNANGSFVYTPTLNFNGSDSFTYKANDGTADSNTATVTIAVSAVVRDTEVTLTGGVLTITDVDGGASNDALTISYAGGTYTLVETGGLSIKAAIAGATGNGSSTVTFPDTGVTSIVFDLLGGNDSITVSSLQASLSGGFTITAGTGDDSATINGDIVTIGAGAVTIIVSRNIVMAAGSSITTVDGGITLAANTAGTTTGGFVGIAMNSAIVSSTGSGAISLNGTGGNVSRGVQLLDSAAINSTGTGSVTIVANCGAAGCQNDVAFLMDNASQVTSAAGAIDITGSGGAGIGGSQGVALGNGTLIAATGNAAITLRGNGGTNGGYNHGISMGGTATVRAVDGDIQVIGVGHGNPAAGGFFTAVQSTGSGNVTITGIGVGTLYGDVAARDPALFDIGPSGTLTLNANTVSLSAGTVVSGSGDLVFQPRTATASIGLGGGSGTLNLTDAELATLNDGFNSITIGNTSSGIGAVNINTVTFRDPVTLAGGTIKDNAGADIAAAGNTVTLDGNVAPGLSLGILEVTGNFVFADNDTFTVEIGGTTPGTAANNHDQINVAGTVTIGGNITLAASTVNGYRPAGGDTIIIINNDGTEAVTGTFNGLTEGAIIAASGIDMRISYVGGDGNDVVLIVVNVMPVAVDDANSTNEDSALTVAAPGLLGNDSDGNVGDTLTAILVSNVANGTLALSADGSYVYTPTLNFNGSDSFTYKANDGTADSNTATVTITVNAVNDAPAAVNDSYRGAAGQLLTVGASNGLLFNDTDVENNPLTAVLVAHPNHGTLNLNANGSFTYTPVAGFSGTDTFSYHANDGSANSAVATVTLTVLTPVSLIMPTAVSAPSGGTTMLPVTFNGNGNAVSSIVFSIDYAESCLSLNPTDANSDGIPDALSFNLPTGFSSSAQLDVTDTDGELDIVISGISSAGAIPTGQIVTITFQVSSATNCANNTVPVNFSADPTASFGDNSGGQVPGQVQAGSVLIGSGGNTPIFGNCNTDQKVDAGDISALVLEIFDGDGNMRSNAPGGTFPGSPTCDANEDTFIDAGDISCMVLIIFNGPGACGGSGVTDAAAAASAQLSVPQQLTAVAGDAVAVPVLLQPVDQQVTAATFTLTFDPNVFTFDPTDSDEDGIPDAVIVPIVAHYESQVSYDAATGRLMIARFANRTDAAPFAAGALATVTLTVQAGQSGDHELTLADSSLGNADGQNVAVTPSDGSLQIVSETQTLLYLPVIVR